MEALQSSGLIENDESGIKNYVLVLFNEQLDVQEGEKNSITILSRFEDENGQAYSAGDITIDGTQTVSPSSTNDYNRTYAETETPQGLTMLGRDISISLQGSNYIDPEQRTIYVPTALYPGTLYVPYNSISRSQNKQITWNPDPSNMFEKVIVQVYYYSSLSRYNNPSAPARINSLVYVADDNGSFTIPGADLNRFPAGGYVNLSVSRATDVNYANARTTVDYIAVVSSSTSPLLVIN